MKLVPDTSVIVDRRLTELIASGTLAGADVIIPHAVLAELEHQAQYGKSTGFSGLDELAALQTASKEGRLNVHFHGPVPSVDDIVHRRVDALIRTVAEETGATLCTSDMVQAKSAQARGLNVSYIPPLRDETELYVLKYFDSETMSVHLRDGCRPFAKKGKPGAFTIVELADTVLTTQEIETLVHQLIAYTKRDPDSFIEIERTGVTVAQLGNMRTVIAKPPFSDRHEITITRPIAKLSLGDYHLDNEVQTRLSDYHRGILVSGPPGSGKSTFSQAVADYLYGLGAIVKTMECPRDLQVRNEITQYAPLENKMELTSDILLLVRPDFVVFDEVRRGGDFRVFADMRLAGVGLIGVTHANRAIDAIQRLIGRVELGMIPQVVDTVIHIMGGKIAEILELDFTVKIPYGMEEADLSRPVITVKNFFDKQTLYEIYTYGEQVVVMPVQGDTAQRHHPLERMAEQQLYQILQHYVDTAFDITISGGKANVYVDEVHIPYLIGRGGKTISAIEREAGIKINIHPRAAAEADIVPSIIKRKKDIVVRVDARFKGKNAAIMADGDTLFSGTMPPQGFTIARASPLGKRLINAIAEGERVTVRIV